MNVEEGYVEFTVLLSVIRLLLLHCLLEEIINVDFFAVNELYHVHLNYERVLIGVDVL